ncbi:hypothetical protein Cgig2_009622 [Carnegiea gigantea]|uniref:Uncharacterized protein n=1 Tax=Carnegiea gigantea TaxID=171969 RepID=A0A9Q1JV61_9CARY|nr:hypothetical protein Cgig2_009622 [Carnegiea gigantea]
MMMPSLSTSSSSASVTTRVDKATSELLVGPDWTMNMEICDICNSNHWLAKDVVKSVKRRLQHKSPKVQLLALTLLETMVKNCGEYIHYHMAERKIVDEMIKIVKKKKATKFDINGDPPLLDVLHLKRGHRISPSVCGNASADSALLYRSLQYLPPHIMGHRALKEQPADIHVREKILALLDSWQEAFGGPSGKYTQYYWACDELRRYGIQFPQRSRHSAPVITPPVTHPPAVTHVGFGMPPNSSRRLDEAMTSEVESLSASTLKSMENVLEVLDDMLQAVNPNDLMAVKDEVIVDLVDRCRANQKKLLQMITNTTDEELLVKGIEMNDSLQLVLAKHDALASGAPLPTNGSSVNVQPHELANSSLKTSEAGDKNPAQDAKSSASAVQGEEEEDEFAQLARRHSKAQSTPSQNAAAGATEDSASSSGSNALVLADMPAPDPAPTNTAKEQDLIDLLSIVLTTSSTASETPQASNPAPVETTMEASLNSYVVPWAQPQPQVQPQPQSQAHYQPMQPQLRHQVQHGYSQYSSVYPPPPWEATPTYSNNQCPVSNPYVHPVSQGNMNGSIPMQGTSSSQNINSFQSTQYGNQLYPNAQNAVNSSSPMPGTQSLQQVDSIHSPAVNGNLTASTPSSQPMQSVPSLQQFNSFPVRTSNGLAMNGNVPVTSGPGSIPSGQKPFIPSYRLFEDLNVFGSSEGKLKSGPYPSASGNPSQNIIAGKR